MNPIERASRAQALLDDDLFKEGFDAVERAIIARLRAGATDKDAEWLLSLRLMEKIRGWFRQQVENGKVELHVQNEKERKK